MKLVRMKSFETNSSSSHSVTLHYTKADNEDVTSFKDGMLHLLNEDGKVVIDLVERLSKGSQFGVENKQRLIVYSDYSDRDLELDGSESETFYGYGDYVGKLIMVFSILISSNYHLIKDLVMCVFDYTNSSNLEELFPNNTRLANLLTKVSKGLGYPLVFYLGEDKEVICDLEDLAGSICDDVGNFEETVELKFLIDKFSYIRSTVADY